MQNIASGLGSCVRQSPIVCRDDCIGKGLESCVCEAVESPYEPLVPTSALITFFREDAGNVLIQMEVDVYIDVKAEDLCLNLAREGKLNPKLNWNIVEIWKSKRGEYFERILEEHELVLRTHEEFCDYIYKKGGRTPQYNFRSNCDRFQFLENLPYDLYPDQCPLFGSVGVRNKTWGGEKVQFLLLVEGILYKVKDWTYLYELNTLTMPKNPREKFNHPTIEYFFHSEINKSKLKQLAKIRDYKAYYFIQTDTPNENSFILLLRPSSPSEKERLFKLLTEENIKKWINNMRLAKYGKQLRENYRAFKARQSELSTRQGVANRGEENFMEYLPPLLQPSRTRELPEDNFMELEFNPITNTLDIPKTPKSKSKENTSGTVHLGQKLRESLARLRLIHANQREILISAGSPGSPPETPAIGGAAGSSQSAEEGTLSESANSSFSTPDTGAKKKTRESRKSGKSKGSRKKRDDDSDKLASHVPMDFTGKVGKIVEDPEEARKIAEGSDCGQRSLRPARTTRPSGQPEEPQDHLSEPWFHNVPREEANRMLLKCQDDDPDGLFIVRPSRTIPGHYVVSYRHRRTIHHVQIIAKYDRIGQLWTYTIDNGLRKFKDLIMVVQYLQNNTAGLYCRMTQFLARNEAFDEPNAPPDTPEYKVVQLSALYKTYNLPISPSRSNEATSPKSRHYQE